MQRRHDDFEGRFLGIFRVRVDRDAAAIVRHGQVAVGVQPDLDPVGMAGNGLVHGIVEHLGKQVVIGALVRAADIHAGALADGLEAFEDFNVLCGVTGRVGAHLVKQLSLLGGSHVWSPLGALRVGVDTGAHQCLLRLTRH